MSPALILVLPALAAVAAQPDPMLAWSWDLRQLDEDLQRAVITWQAERSSVSPDAVARWHQLRARVAAISAEQTRVEHALRAATLEEAARTRAQEQCAFEDAATLHELARLEADAEHLWRGLEPQLNGRGEALLRWWLAWVEQADLGDPQRPAQVRALAELRSRATRALPGLSREARAEAARLFSAVDIVAAVEADLTELRGTCAARASAAPSLDIQALEEQAMEIDKRLKLAKAELALAEPAALQRLANGADSPAQRQLRELSDKLAEADDQLASLEDAVSAQDWCLLHVDRALVSELHDGVDQDHALRRATAAYRTGCQAELLRWREIETLHLAWQLLLTEQQQAEPARLWLPLGEGRWSIDGQPVLGSGTAIVPLKAGLHRIELRTAGGRILLRHDELQQAGRYALRLDEDRIALYEPPDQDDPENFDGTWTPDLGPRPESVPSPLTLRAPSDPPASRFRLFLGPTWLGYTDAALEGERAMGPTLSFSYAIVHRERLDLELGLSQDALLGANRWCYGADLCLPVQLHERLALGLRWDDEATLRPGLALELGAIPGVAPELGGRLDLDWRQGSGLFAHTSVRVAATLWRDGLGGPAGTDLNLSASAGLGAYLRRL